MLNKFSKISIIIRCYNEEEHIGRLLSGIMEQTIKGVEIVLVDSGSTDATLSIASHFPVKILSIKPEDFSFGYSLNIGCQAALGQYLVIASAHVYPTYNDWLEKLIAPFSEKQVALVYGKQRGNEITKYSEHQIFSIWFPEQSNYNQTNLFCNNANAAIRRDLWEKHHYDETLTGLEDLAWAKTIKDKGYKLIYEANAEIIHVHNESFLRLHNRYKREAIALKNILPQEYFSFFDFIRLFLSNAFSDWLNAFKEKKLFDTFLNILCFRFMQFLGTYQGFRHHGRIGSELKQTFYYPSKLKQKTTVPPERLKKRINYSTIYPKNHHEKPD